MSVNIGHASIDENGKASGGQAGDQNKKEVCTRSWYSKPWQYYLECVDENIANIAATYMEQICANDNVGYNQFQRLTLYNQLKVHKDVSKLTPCECDCSSLVACCYIMAGLNINPSCTTRNVRSALLSTGKFKAYSDVEHLTSDKYAKRGGLYLKEGSHIIMALENGENIQSTIIPNNYKLVVDISHHNTIKDWNLLKQTTDTIIIRAGYISCQSGTLTTDNKFKQYIQEATNLNMKIGVYAWDQSLNEQEAIGLANYIAGLIKPYKISLPIYIDSEAYTNNQGRADKISKEQRTKNIIAFCDAIKNYGYIPGVYASDSWFKSMLEFEKIKQYEIWCARYSANKPTISKYEAWQYGSKQFSWSTAPIDVNYFYKDYLNSSSSAIPSIQQSNVTTETSIEMIGKINTTSSNLNIRSAPNANATKVSSYKKGELVQIVSKTTTNWYQTDKGYISGDYVVVAIGKVSNCTKLNMRKEPEVKSNNIISILDVNTELYLLKAVDGWYKTKTKDGIVGYVSQKYITVL